MWKTEAATDKVKLRSELLGRPCESAMIFKEPRWTVHALHLKLHAAVPLPETAENCVLEPEEPGATMDNELMVAVFGRASLSIQTLHHSRFCFYCVMFSVTFVLRRGFKRRKCVKNVGRDGNVSLSPCICQIESFTLTSE